MALNWRPRTSQLYLPRRGALKDAVNQSYSAMFGTTQGVLGSSQFEAPRTTAFVQGGRAGVQGGDFVAETLMPLPARALEAPLRPLNALTGGAVGDGIAAVYNHFRGVPGIGNVLGIIEGTVGVMEASNKSSRALLNQKNAQLLVDTAKLPGAAKLPDGMSVADFRTQMSKRWGTNEFTGEQMTLEQLTERARENAWNFGEFRTSDNALVSFIQEAATDPINLAGMIMTGGGTALARTGIKAAASWARPTVSLAARELYLPRVGIGALNRLRGADIIPVSFPRATQYLDTMGNVGVGPATLGNLVDLAGKIYFPKYGLLTAPRVSQLTEAQKLLQVRTGLGLSKPVGALAAWELGGATQMGVGSAAEWGLGVINQRHHDQETGVATSEADGFFDGMQDMLHAINNNHPLSENQTFMILALFSPWMPALSAAVRRTHVNPQAYYNQGAKYMSQLFPETTFKSEADFFTRLGDGDMAEGIRRFEIRANQTDMILVQNQFSGFTNQVVDTIEAKVQRADFLTEEVIDTIIARRASGALGGRSLADNMLRFYREGFDSNPETRLAQGDRTITFDGFVRSLERSAAAEQHMLNEGLAKMGNLIVKDGASITKELIGGMLNRLAHLDPDARIPREVASFIIEDNPNLIYMTDFWREFSYTLGQMMEGTGKFGADKLPTEGITVAQVRAHLEELIDTAPRESEIFHESFQQLERKRLSQGQAASVLHSVVPEDTPAVMKSMRQRFVTMGTHAETLRSKVVAIRNKEFFRNGKPRFATATTLIGHFGNPFRQREPGSKTYVKTAPKYKLEEVPPRSAPKTISIGDGAPPIENPHFGSVQMSFEDADGRPHEFWASKVYAASIGDKDVYIFRPDIEEAYFANRALDIPADNFTAVKFGGGPMISGVVSDRYTIKETDLWYATRKNSNGTLLINQGFSTAKEAADWVHSVSDAAVAVTLDDGVFTIDGKITPPRREEIMPPGLTDEFSNNMDSLLGNTWERWQDIGKTRKPHSVIYEEADYTIPGYSRPDRTYYFVGDDGMPHGLLQILFDTEGAPQSPSVFVDPEYRGSKPYGRPSYMLYDQAFADGIDLSQASGRINTPQGAVAIDRYWADRRNTMDTEALDLAIQNGGRITEVEVMPELTVSTRPRMDILYNTGDEYSRLAAKIPELPDSMEDSGYIYKIDNEDVVLIHTDDDGFMVIDARDDDLLYTQFSNYEDAVDSLSSKKFTSGGVQHAATLARHGLEEVARYGHTASPRIFKAGDRANVVGDIGYLHRFEPVSGFLRIKKKGLKAGISHEAEPAGIHTAVDVSEAYNLAPDGMKNNGMLMRIKESEVSTVRGRWGDNELVITHGVKPELIEYYSSDGKWYPITTIEHAVFAYRGGDTTKALLNSRVEGANLRYTPSTRRTATRQGALNIARKRANDASIEYPTLETLGPGYTNSRTFFSPEERRLHLNELSKSLDQKALSNAESVQMVDDALQLVSGLDKVTDINHWWDSATPEQVRQLTVMVKELNHNWPSLRIGEGTGRIYIDPRQERLGHLMTGYSSMARHVFDYGFLSPISRFYDALFVPMHARALQKDVLTELRVQTALIGMTPEQTTTFLEGVRQRVSESRSARGLGNIVGLHKSRNIRALDESTLRVLIEEAASEETLVRIVDRFGSVQKMVTEAANGLLRRSISRSRHGGKVSKLEAAAQAAFRHYQYDPVLEHVSDVTHSMSKFWYPLFRFAADPAFIIMNLIEPYVYGISRNGVQKMRRQRTPAQQELNRRAIERSSKHSIPAGGYADVESLPIETLMTDAGVFSIPRNMRSSIENEHQVGRMDSAQRVLMDIPKSDPLAQIFQERFGSMDPKQWAKEMDNVMYSWMNDGPEASIKQAFDEMTEHYGFTPEELQIMAPFINRLSEMQRALYDDLADLYIGRLNRTGIERVFDNFWLLWPLSYQIKATKWLATIMFHKIGGVKTGPLGAIMYTEYRDRFMRAIENDDDMKEWLEDNRDFIFLFEMMLPMSPESIGVSLNKTLRITSSWLNAMTINNDAIRDMVGDYDYIESVPEMAENASRFGPIRTWNLFKRLTNQLEVPGFTYGNSGSSSGNLDEYTPSR